MSIVAAALVAAMSFGGSTQAQSDFSVDPDRRNSSINIKGERVERPSKRNDSSASPSPDAAVAWNRPKRAVCGSNPEDTISADRGYFYCVVPPAGEDEPVDPARPTLTLGAILQAVRELPLPRLQIQVQPGDSTLVNVPTIFYAEPRPFRQTVTLLGAAIDVEATAVSFRWHHGDGTSHTTSRAGRPYPAMDVTHRYREPADAVSPSVDVTYRVRYRVDGGTWSTLTETIPAPGPATTLEVREAAPVLTKP